MLRGTSLHGYTDGIMIIRQELIISGSCDTRQVHLEFRLPYLSGVCVASLGMSLDEQISGISCCCCWVGINVCGIALAVAARGPGIECRAVGCIFHKGCARWQGDACARHIRRGIVCRERSMAELIAVYHDRKARDLVLVHRDGEVEAACQSLQRDAAA